MLPTPIKLFLHNHQSSQPDTPLNHQAAIPDLFFYLKGHLIPTYTPKISKCGMFHPDLQKNQKLIFIDQDINLSMFQKIIRFLEGDQLQLKTMKQLASCLDVLDFIQARQYIDYLEKYIQQEIQAYDIFCILDLAFKYGMQKIFDLGLSYLQVDQFEQIKYNKFDFLECDFKLFQIILRRHHILKMRDQIEGLDVFDVQEIIRIYCQRKQFDAETLNRLLNKYVVNLERFDKVKTSLRLDKLAHKKILESANIDTDFYDNQGTEDLRQLFKSPSIRFHKYSIEMRHQQRIINEERFKDMYFAKITQPEVESIFRESSKNSQVKSQYEIKINSVNKEQKINEEMERCLGNNGKGNESCEADVAVSKLTGILHLYEQALNEHELKYKKVRRNSRSMLFENLGHKNDILSQAKLLNSSRITGLNRLFTIFEPNQ